ncbi:hypothetical protein Dvar_10470 [Desulfosarcina variabilis str. Montpellier]|uniref:DUF4136 domain-containing protein n=1 Tax=Desulfosarcina variabilis TaxID=2300 RepID=UPI003AFB35AF
MKKKMTIFCLLVCCLGIIAGCSPIYGVKYDYNRQIDFSMYNTDDWMPAPDKAVINDLVIDRIKKAVDSELSAKGLKKTSQDPDFLIAEHIGKKDKNEADRWGYGYYGPILVYRGGFWGVDDVSAYHYEEGVLILDFIDAGTKKLFWRGIAKAHVQNIDTPEKSEKLINEAVKKILEKYPPPIK